MRKCDKSKFRDVVIDLFPSSKLFVTECSTLATNHELIVDFLFFVASTSTPRYCNFLIICQLSMGKKVVVKLGIKRGTNIIRIIVDKPKYLPKPRDLLHVSRSTRTGEMNINDREVWAIPHCSEYQQFLANA